MNTGSTFGKGKVVLTALLSGLVLGVLARAWMRWISTDPEFSWSGTIFIVMAFTIFTSVQSIVFLLRKRFKGKRSALLIRTGGVIFSLPLFTAAGAIMFPTVALASVGIWNTALGKRTRGILLILSLIIPIKISFDLVSDFGWTIGSFGRILLFALIYILVIIAIRPTMTPFRGENSEIVKMSKTKKIFLGGAVLSIGLLFLFLTVGITRN